jgi:hypothetical protein
MATPSAASNWDLRSRIFSTVPTGIPRPSGGGSGASAPSYCLRLETFAATRSVMSLPLNAAPQRWNLINIVPALASFALGMPALSRQVFSASSSRLAEAVFYLAATLAL